MSEMGAKNDYVKNVIKQREQKSRIFNLDNGEIDYSTLKRILGHWETLPKHIIDKASNLGSYFRREDDKIVESLVEEMRECKINITSEMRELITETSVIIIVSSHLSIEYSLTIPTEAKEMTRMLIGKRRAFLEAFKQVKDCFENDTNTHGNYRFFETRITKDFLEFSIRQAKENAGQNYPELKYRDLDIMVDWIVRALEEVKVADYKQQFNVKLNLKQKETICIEHAYSAFIESMNKCLENTIYQNKLRDLSLVFFQVYMKYVCPNEKVDEDFCEKLLEKRIKML